MAEHSVNSRLVALTDGVVTIAQTLLVLDIKLPDPKPGAHLEWHDLWSIHEQLSSYALSFIVVTLLWLTHAQKFRSLQHFTIGLFWLNTLFLMAVGLVPFTTSLLSHGATTFTVSVYAGTMAFASLMLTFTTLHVVTAGLGNSDRVKGRLRLASLLHFSSAAVFASSIIISFVNPRVALFSWLLLVPIAFMPEIRYETT